MRITQGCFSFLPDLTDDQILTQVQYCLDQGWAVNLEFTDDPHPRNTYWEMWGLPMFDLQDAKGVLLELNACRKIYGDRYIRLSIPRTAGNRCAFRSSSIGRKTRTASAWIAPKRKAACSATRRALMRPTGQKESATNERGRRSQAGGAGEDQ